MRKILLIGSGGAGKSWLAAELAARLNVPLIHLDQLFWQAGWIDMPRDQWHALIAERAEGEPWIMDGNYSGTLELRLAACDTVIFLDLPPLLCAWRVLKRWLRFRGRTRPDMAAGCPEKLDWKFLSWILFYRRTHRPKLLERLEGARQSGKQVIILQSRAAVDGFLRALARKDPGKSTAAGLSAS